MSTPVPGFQPAPPLPGDRLPSPGQDLAEAFASYVQGWARRIARENGQALAARSAYWVRRAALLACQASLEGHGCTHLEHLLRGAAPRESRDLTLEALAELLLDTGMVGWPEGEPEQDTHPALAGLSRRFPQVDSRRPLILDRGGRLYLRRYFVHERRLARALRRMALHRPGLEPDAATRLKPLLDQIFPADQGPGNLGQKLGVGLALGNTLTLLSGGPGTGKTTTVVALLASLLFLHPHLRIGLAAPTGKAAARLLEAIAERREALTRWLPPESLAGFPASASTVHGLLGVKEQGGFHHHQNNPLLLDVLVVDEASMLDLALADRLVDALAPGSRLILLGDKDQLSAVETGAVFAELSGVRHYSGGRLAFLAELAGPSPLPADLPPSCPPVNAGPQDAGAAPPLGACLDDCVWWLDHSFRFSRDSGIGQLARRVRQGLAPGEDSSDLLALLSQDDRPDRVVWIPRHPGSPEAPPPGNMTLAPEGPEQIAIHQALIQGFEPYFTALTELLDSPAGVTAGEESRYGAGKLYDDLYGRFLEFRVLCGQRRGTRGVAGLNQQMAALLQAHLARQGVPLGRGPWFPGRPVLIQRNDPLLGLYNGDIGLCLPGPRGSWQVVFPPRAGDPKAVADQASPWRSFAPGRLPEHETAFAMTVHKAQGSEFDAVLLILPDAPNPLLTRELLYTGITRARRKLMLWSSPTALEAACRASTDRLSGLLQRN